MGYRRLAGIAGVIAVIALVAQLPYLAKAPAPATSGEKVLSFLVANHRGLQLAIVLSAVASFFFIFFLSGLWSAVRTSGGGDAPGWAAAIAGGGIAFVSVALVASAIIDGLLESSFARIVSPQAVSAIWITGNAVFAAGAAFLAVFAVAVAGASLKLRALPSGIGWLAVATAVLAILGIPAIASARTLFALFVELAQLATMITILVTGLWLMREQKSG